MDVQNRSNAVNRGLQTRSSDLNSGTLTALKTSGYSDLREQAQVEWLESSLTNRAASDPQGFGQTLELALGSRADRATINALVDSSVSGNLPLPNVRFVDAGVLGAGALGAYDPRNGGTVLLDSSLLNDSRAMERVYLEEVGHHLDAQFGAGDAVGDEGAIFARSLLGESLTGTQMNSLRAENDHGAVRLDGDLVRVEFHFGSDTPGGSVDGIGGKESNTGSTSNDSYSDNDHEITKPKPPPKSPAPALTGGYDEVGIDVKNTRLGSSNEEHGYDEVGIDVPAPAEGPPSIDDDDVLAAGIATTIIDVPIDVPRVPTGSSWWGRIAGVLGRLAGSSPIVAGAAGIVYSPAAGDVYDFEWSATGTTIHHDGPMGQATVVVNGVDTGIRVDFDKADDGTISNVRPSTESDAQQLEQVTGVSVAPTDQPEQADASEPEPLDTGSIDFPAPPEDLTPEELALAFADTPTPEPLPETPVQASPIATPPAAEAPVANVAAPVIPGVPPLTPPVVDNGPLVNPQPVADIGPTTMPGGSNGTGLPETPGFTHTESEGSTPPSHVNDTPAITILESRVATDEEVEATIGSLMEAYPQYSEEELLEIAADGAHGGGMTLDSLEELEVAVGAHANGLVTGSLQPAIEKEHDFVTKDENGRLTTWDVKSLNSDFPYNLSGFLTKTFEKDITKHGERIVFNTQNMSIEDIIELEQALIDDSRFSKEMYVLYPAR